MKFLTNLMSRTGGILPVKRMKKPGALKQDYKWKGIKLIPNAKRVRIELSGMDKLFALFGITKRSDKAILDITPHNNKRLNRYIIHQFKRMDNTNDPILFWRIGMTLVRRSNIFLVMALNHVFPHWHRNMKLSSVVRLAIEVRRIAACEDSKLDFKRVYIEKGAGKWRPLGVPTPAWRIYLHMINVILTMYMELKGKAHPDQHGFRPSRGTLTAWEKVLTEVIHSRDIYEFDLKGFFDSVNLDYISAKLIEIGVPVNIVQRLYYINLSSVKVKPPYRLNEFESSMKKLMTKGASFEEVIKAPRPISYMYRARGVPQGSPTSPVLATLGLHGSILDRPNLKTIMYADDGLYYGEIDSPVITPNSGIVSSNIYFNLEKSGWIKRDGQWIKPLKFLGLEFDGEVFKGSTRKGSKLIYDKDELIKMILERDSVTNKDGSSSYGHFIVDADEGSWNRLVRSKVFGLIQSRMYSGAWNLDNLEQCFELTYSKNSWVKKYGDSCETTINVFNSTTFASEWLVGKLKTIKSLKKINAQLLKASKIAPNSKNK